MIIININGLLGDALSTLPAIWAAAEKNEHVYLASQNFEVSCLLPPSDKITHIKNLNEIFGINNLTNERIYILDASRNFNHHCGAGIHMSQGHFKFLDLPLPTEVPTVKLHIEPKEVESFDFIISMYSRSDDHNNKLWPLDRWAEIIDWLVSQGYSVATIGSGSHEEEILPNSPHHIHGRGLNEVANYLLTVKKALLSPDNGLSHFARILGVRHLLLYPTCLPSTWVSNPNENALMYRKAPLEITVEEVKEQINNLLKSIR
jgi:ADP-heptose:LPS heptosyltransferase